MSIKEQNIQAKIEVSEKGNQWWLDEHTAEIHKAEKDLNKALNELIDFIKKNGGKIINEKIEN